MISSGLRQLQDALNRKADSIQHSFIAISARLAEIERELPRVYDDERPALTAEQETLRSRQAEVANEINMWRERAFAITQQRSEQALRAYLRSLLDAVDETLQPDVERALNYIDAPDAGMAALTPGGAMTKPITPAGRLIQRARAEHDLRSAEPAPRQRAAVEFANRPGMAQDEAAIAEIEAALNDPDPMAREMAALAAIQLHRFRATRMADLDAAHESVLRLTRFNHPAVVPVFIEVLEHPRTGFVNGDEEGNNDRSRMAALTRLVEWHTADAQNALKGRQFDRDPQIARVAARALELFPGEWAGPLKGTGN
ncbi:MAG: hypothetical protein HY260_22940 [Chloroflexi bacterium]|nr:hypothetical protein [Chloroflexota bacterium]